MSEENRNEIAVILSKILKAINQQVVPEYSKLGLPKVHVDESMFNAARVVRLLGTNNCKGKSIDGPLDALPEPPAPPQPLPTAATPHSRESANERLLRFVRHWQSLVDADKDRAAWRLRP